MKKFTVQDQYGKVLASGREVRGWYTVTRLSDGASILQTSLEKALSILGLNDQTVVWD